MRPGGHCGGSEPGSAASACWTSSSDLWACASLLPLQQTQRAKYKFFTAAFVAEPQLKSTPSLPLSHVLTPAQMK